MRFWAPAVFLPLCFGPACGQSVPVLPPAPVPLPAPKPAAQPSAPTQPADLYANEGAVIERYERRYTYAADGTGVRDITNVIDVKTAAGVKAWSIVQVAFASSAEHVEIDYVRVRHADGTVVVTPNADAQEQPAPVTREAPFYSDLKQTQIPVKSLREGDHLEYHLRIVRTKAEAAGHFWGAETFFTPTSQAVVLSEVVELHVPKDAYVQTWSADYQPVKTTTATESVFRWESAQLKPVTGKTPYQLLAEDFKARQTDEQGNRLPSIAWTNFKGWAEVGAWYRGLEGSRTTPDDEVRAKALQLTAGKTSEEDKARAIYGFVGPQIRYIGVAFGIGRYQPHEAAEVLGNQYGDCKDKVTLLAAMLSAVGISSDAVLIGAGVAFNADVPSPGAFNHAITLAHVDGKPVWLDATTEVAPYRLLLPQLRGSHALVIPNEGPARLEVTPLAPPFPLEDHLTADGTLDDQGTSHSKLTMVLRGDAEVVFRSGVHSVSPAQWDQLMQQISYALNFAGKVTNAQFSSPTDLGAPFHASWDYEREKSGDWPNLRILPQLTPLGLPVVDEKEPPLVPIELGSPHVETAHAVMKLPAGWGAQLPEAVHAKAAFATLEITYKFEDGRLIADRRFEVLERRVPAVQWTEYQSWYKAAGLGDEGYVQLTRSGGSRKIQPADDEATRLLVEVQGLLQQSSSAPVAAKLDRVKKLNPHQPYLWSLYGYVAQIDGNMAEAADDYKHEVDDHPEEQFVYRSLIGVQLLQHHPEETMKTARKLLARFPDDDYGTGILARLQVQANDLASADATLATAVATRADDSLKTQLAAVLVKEGKREQAQKILSSVARESKDPAAINNAAYALANESLDAGLASSSARRALTLLNDRATSTDESEKAGLVRASLQVHLWDTLGWALFRNKRMDEAEGWIRAAWTNSLSAEVALHLGELQEQQGKSREALEIYSIAAAMRADPNRALPANRKTFEQTTEDIGDASDEQLATHIQAVSAKGVKPLHELDRVILPDRLGVLVERAEGAPGGTDTLLLTVNHAGTAEDVRVLSGDESLDPVVRNVTKATLGVVMPPDDKATLLRVAFLHCEPVGPCFLSLVQPMDAISFAK